MGEFPKNRSSEIPHLIWKSMLNHAKDESLLGDDELALFKWYADETERFIAAMQEKALHFIQEQEDAGEESNDVNDSGLMAVEYYSDRMRYSHVIYLTTLLEHYLARASEKLNRNLDRSLVFQPDDLQGDKWNKHKKFIEKYGQCKFPSDAWKTLQTLISVRNILVHENGDVGSNKKNKKDVNGIINRIIRCPGLKVVDGEILVKFEYIEHCFSAFENLVEHVDLQVKQSFERGEQPRTIK